VKDEHHPEDDARDRLAEHRYAPRERLANELNDRRGQLAQIRQGAFLDLSPLAVGLAQQNGRGRAAIGDGVDVHGYHL